MVEITVVLNEAKQVKASMGGQKEGEDSKADSQEDLQEVQAPANTWDEVLSSQNWEKTQTQSPIMLSRTRLYNQYKRV